MAVFQLMGSMGFFPDVGTRKNYDRKGRLVKLRWNLVGTVDHRM
jgi:hypothetical protein